MSTSSSSSEDPSSLQREVQRAQAEIMPREDLRPYAGRWVALRDGYVVASDIDSAALRNRSEVEKSDVVLRVPDPDITVFIL